MASFMEKYHVSQKEYMNMPCALISLMMLDAPKVLYGKKLLDHTKGEIADVMEQNNAVQNQSLPMAEILKQNG